MSNSAPAYQRENENTTTDRRSPHDELRPCDDLIDYARHYAREKPEVVAMWCFGVGFILGWKLKPW